jgi:soluble lytic murein transglycosylase
MIRQSWAQISVNRLKVVLLRCSFVCITLLGSLWAFAPSGSPCVFAQTSGSDTSSATQSAAPAKTPAAKSPDTATPAKKPASKTAATSSASTSKSGTSAAGTTHKKTATTTHKKRKHKEPTLRVKRVHQAFVASTTLRPMAEQLLQDRTPAAYAGVEAYAQKHSAETAGSLAYLVLGYAHSMDHDYAKAIDPLNRAKTNPGELGEYITYNLGNAYLQTGHSAEAVATLQGFSKKYPDSLLITDADVALANGLLAEGHPQTAAEVLEKDRPSARPDVALTLGRAYEASGDNAKAATSFKNVYYNMASSSEADAAGTELKKLGVTSASTAEHKTRAELLFKAKRYADSATEYRDVLDQAAPADRPAITLLLASALQKSGNGKDAKQVLSALPETAGEVNAQRWYQLGEIARSSDDEASFQAALAQLRQSSPSSTWFEQALLSEGNMYLLKRNYDKAIDAYRELQARFPNGSRTAYAHWKIAWLGFRQNRNDEAKKEFENHIALYPASAEVPNALYWRGRLAEEDGEPAKARAYYQKLSDRFRNYYYAELGRQRMRTLKTTGEPVHYAILDRIPAFSPPKIEDDDPPTENLRYQKAQLLANGALVDLAVRELQAAAAEDEGGWAPAETARIYQEIGRYDRAIQAMKRTVPNYFALELPELPKSYWEALFPKPYWDDLRRYSEQNSLDPYLVASLIRQESEFNPGAISRANAVGLMQLLPSTAKKVAKDEKVKNFNANQLLSPNVNMQLGTRYFRGMVDKFGAFEYALAAYNAGDDRVKDWLGQGKYRDPQEFVESIPFTETREYVQAILRNANVYRQLYGTP